MRAETLHQLREQLFKAACLLLDSARQAEVEELNSSDRIYQAAHEAYDLFQQIKIIQGE